MKIVRSKELAALLGVSRTTIWRWRQSGNFPEPILMGPKLIGWSQQEIELWINSLKG